MANATRTAAAIFALSLPAAAQTAPEAAVLSRVIDQGCYEIVESSNGCERVTLLRSEAEPDTADLIIMPYVISDDQAPLITVRSIAFAGAMWGTLPYLENTENGVRLWSEQQAIGRHPWFESLDIIQDGAAFQIAGYSYSTYDRALPRYFTCQMDLVSGVLSYDLEIGDPENPDAPPEVISEAVTIDARPIPLADWAAFGLRPEACQTAAAPLYSD